MRLVNVLQLPTVSQGMWLRGKHEEAADGWRVDTEMHEACMFSIGLNTTYNWNGGNWHKFFSVDEFYTETFRLRATVNFDLEFSVIFKLKTQDQTRDQTQDQDQTVEYQFKWNTKSEVHFAHFKLFASTFSCFKHSKTVSCNRFFSVNPKWGGQSTCLSWNSVFLSRLSVYNVFP